MGRKIGTFGLVNYRRHPENPNYIVFGFNSAEEADIFERELGQYKIGYERDEDTLENNEIIYLFAVLETNLDEANRANAAVKRMTRDPLLKNNLLRYALFAFVVGLAILAIIGYVKNSPNVTSDELPGTQDSTTFME